MGRGGCDFDRSSAGGVETGEKRTLRYRFGGSEREKARRGEEVDESERPKGLIKYRLDYIQ